MSRSPASAAPLYEALTIAKWFVSWARSNDADLSNLKLQKLLYYAQGYHLAIARRALFGDAIQAWSHGPVVKDVYHQFKRFGSGDVELEPGDAFDWDHVDPETTQFLMDIWDKFGGIAAWRLRNMTHAEAPWREHFEEGSKNVEIPLDTLERHFGSVIDSRG